MTIPEINVANPVGSGDATVAGMAVALKRNLPVHDVLKTVMTTGMLNALEETIGFIDTTKFSQFSELVQVEKIES